MKLFPTKKFEIELAEPLESALEKLRNETEPSTSLASEWTKKTFTGQVTESGFKLISSAVGHGPFCILDASFEGQKGTFTAYIHPVFKGLVAVLLFFPILGIVFVTVMNGFGDLDEHLNLLILLPIMFILLRFGYVQLLFWYTKRGVINRLFYTIEIKELFELQED